jgi:hypothetical protein
MINGMPQPALLSFALHKTPHLIDLRRLHAADLYRDRLGTAALHDGLVDWGERRGLFFRLIAEKCG